MKKNLPYIILLFVPLIFLVLSSVLRSASGSFYFNLYDPAYVYLLNSLNLAQLNGSTIGHYDHPGTPVQIVGAIVIKVLYGLSRDKTSLVNDVLSRPEVYLFAINKTLNILNTIAVFILGIIIFRISGNLMFSLLIQMSPFVSPETFYAMIDVSPDNFLILSSLFLIAVVMYYFFKVDTGKAPPIFFILMFSLVCGFGIACKLNFFPMLLIPLILIKGGRYKFYFMILTFITFLIFVSPALSNYNNFLKWIESLFIRNDMYGQGEPTIVNPPVFFSNIGKILIRNYFFSIIYFISATVLILSRKNSRHNNSGIVYFRKEYKILLAIFLSCTVEILIVAKHYHPYSQKYLIPAFMISITSLIFSVRIMSILFPGILRRIKINSVYASIMVVILLWNISQFTVASDNLSLQKNESIKTESYIRNNCPNIILISDLESSNNEKALAFSTYFGGNQSENYKNLLSQKFSYNIFFSGWANQFIFMSDSTNIKNKILQERKLIFQMSKFATIEGFMKTLKEFCGTEDIEYRKVFSNDNGESIYEIDLK